MPDRMWKNVRSPGRAKRGTQGMKRTLLQLGYEARRQHLVLVKTGYATFSLWSSKYGNYTMRRATLEQIVRFLDVPQRQHVRREKLQSPTSQILRPHQSLLDARQREQHEREEQAWRSIQRQEVVHNHVERHRMNGGERTAPKPIDTTTPPVAKRKIERVVLTKRHAPPRIATTRRLNDAPKREIHQLRRLDSN